MRITVVLGIGNRLLTDEGVGIHALDHIRQQVPESTNLRYVDGGTLGLMLVDVVEHATNLIVIDAARLQQPPGSVEQFVNSDMDEYLRTRQVTAHDIGLSELLDIARLKDSLPQNRALIGIQPESTSWGLSLSARVDSALPGVAVIARRLIEQWATELA